MHPWYDTSTIFCAYLQWNNLGLAAPTPDELMTNTRWYGTDDDAHADGVTVKHEASSGFNTLHSRRASALLVRLAFSYSKEVAVAFIEALPKRDFFTSERGKMVHLEAIKDAHAFIHSLDGHTTFMMGAAAAAFVSLCGMDPDLFFAVREKLGKQRAAKVLSEIPRGGDLFVRASPAATRGDAYKFRGVGVDDEYLGFASRRLEQAGRQGTNVGVLPHLSGIAPANYSDVLGGLATDAQVCSLRSL